LASAVSLEQLIYKPKSLRDRLVELGVIMGKLEETIVSTLKTTGDQLTLAELSERLGESEKKVFKALRKLFQKGQVESENRRYRLSSQ